jgi:salicylate hydroxylase
LALFPGWHDDLKLLIKSIDSPYKWALMIRPPMDRWGVGRVSLLGDACHATLPFLGQGAAMAMEDGYILAKALEVESNPITALKRYENARRDRTARIVNGSAGNTKRFHNPVLAEPETARAYVDREWAPDKIAERYEWIYTYDVTKALI